MDSEFLFAPKRRGSLFFFTENSMDYCAQMTGLLLFNQNKKGCEENLVVSPLSFSTILNMIAAGSTGNTSSQMLQFLRCKNKDDLNSKFSEIISIASGDGEKGGPVICCANGLWVDKHYPLKASYQELVKGLYKAEAKNVDFCNEAQQVVEEANAWAKSATKGLLTCVLRPEDVNPFSKLVLGNALYFKGAWKEGFNPKSTMNRDFHLLNGEKVSVPFMTGCKEYSHGSFDCFELVEIPYRRGEDRKLFSMYIFLPNERNELPSLLQKAASEPEFFHQDFELKSFPKYDIFWIPKFKFTYNTAEGPSTMTEMGLSSPFVPHCRDLTELIHLKGDDPFFVSNIVQKSFIEIDEVGTKAAAVTFCQSWIWLCI